MRRREWGEERERKKREVRERARGKKGEKKNESEIRGTGVRERLERDR